MKPVLVALSTAGLLGALTVFILSHHWPQHPDPAQKTARQKVEWTSALRPLGTPTGQALRPTLPAPSAASHPDASSQELQLEIERALTSDDPSERDRVYTQLVPALLASDPEAMKRIVADSPPGAIHQELLHHVSHAWSTVNVTGAIQWANDMSDPDERAVAAKEIVAQLGQANPAQAISVADVLGVGRDDGSVEHIALLWAAQDLNASLQWAQAQPPGPERDRLLARVNTIQVQSAPAAAANLALTGIAPGPIQDDAVAAAVRGWSARDAEAASHWVGELPEGRVRDLARAALARAN